MRLTTLRKKVSATETPRWAVSEATIPPQQPQPQPQPASTPPQTPQQPAPSDPTAITGVYQPATNQADPNANTQTWHGDAGRQMIDAVNTLDQMRSDHLKNMPFEQKLELVLKKSTEAEKIAYQALRGISDFDHKLDRVFKELSSQIDRVAGGKPPKQPDPPGSSIWDEDDPESIFGR